MVKSNSIWTWERRKNNEEDSEESDDGSQNLATNESFGNTA